MSDVRSGFQKNVIAFESKHRLTTGDFLKDKVGLTEEVFVPFVEALWIGNECMLPSGDA